MKLLDVHVLIYVHRESLPQYERWRPWFLTLVEGAETFDVSELVLSSFIRIVTNPRLNENASALREALAFVEELRGRPNYIAAAPGARHWALFIEVLQRYNLTGNDVPDAYHAALAIEHNCEWISADQGFARFSGLKWHNPFA